MGIFENIKMAFISIYDNKLRSFLTMISIIIGIASVIAIVSIGRGVTSTLMDSFLAGTNGQMVLSYREKPRKEGDNSLAGDNLYGTVKKDVYTNRQVEDLEAVEGVKAVIKTNSAINQTASYREKEVKDQTIETIMNEQGLLKNQKIVDGRIFSPTEFSKGIQAVVIHEKSAKTMFGLSANAIGKEIIINNKIFSVVGTYKSIFDGQDESGRPEEIFYLPYNSWVSYAGKEEIHQLAIEPEKGEDLKALGVRATKALDANKLVTGVYEVMNFDFILRQTEEFLKTMTLFVTMIAGISLLVGGIGVMNIMYVSVVERMHEIGLRKAIGASGAQILFQFLIESVTLTTVGGLIGIIIGLLGYGLVSQFVGYSFVVYTDVILVGASFSMGIGLLFGTLPAAKAAKMPPIEALRNL
ncbi:MAG: ABC transporter permease [Culicoidibacterales bacterium]